MSLCDIVVLSGDDTLTMPLMAVGAKGVISVLSNAGELNETLGWTFDDCMHSAGKSVGDYGCYARWEL